MIALIVAYTKNRVIGKNGTIPWNLKNEKKRFKELTTNNVVVMGRKTFEEIGRPLPNRFTIVLSKTSNFEYDNCCTAKSLDEAISLYNEKFSNKNLYIAGGSSVYAEAIPIVEKMYITEINSVIEGDRFFPEFDTNMYNVTVNGEYSEEIDYRYMTYTKKVNNTLLRI